MREQAPSSAPSTLDVSVLVIHKGMEEHVDRCLASLFEDPGPVRRAKPTAEVILVSNAAADYQASVSGAYPELVLVATDEPFSVSRYRNLGIARARGRYVLALDADTAVFEDTLAAMVAFMDSHPDAGVAGGQLLFPDGGIQPSGRRFYTWGSMIYRRTPLERWFPDSPVLAEYLILDWDRTTEREVDWVGTGFYCMRRSLVDEIGPFDEGYRYGMEEIDWCLRASIVGYRTHFTPEARVTHYEHPGTQPSRRLFTWFGLEHVRSIVRYHNKHGWWRLSAKRRRAAGGVVPVDSSGGSRSQEPRA